MEQKKKKLKSESLNQLEESQREEDSDDE